MLTSVTAIVLLILLCVMLMVDVPLVAEAVNSETNVDYDKYTDSDTLLNSDKTIQEYESALFSSKANINDGLLTVTGDDPIVQIVPKNLFAEIGEKLYIGK